MPKFSFLLPAFKAKFLKEALISIKYQTYRDFVCIVSDDCSPEDIYNVYQDVVGDDERFTYRRNKMNMGSKSLVAHWNLLLGLCETDYLIIASDDDYYAPHFLETMNDLVVRYPNVGIIRAKCQRVDEDGSKICEDTKLPEFENCIDACTTMFADKKYIHCMQNNVFKANILREAGGCIDFKLAWFSDDATIMACSRNGMVHSKDTLFFFRSSRLQISNEFKTPVPVCKQKIKAATQFCIWLKYRFLPLSKLDSNKVKTIELMAAQRAENISWIYLDKLGFWDKISLFPAIVFSNLFPISLYFKLCMYALIHPIK